MTPSARSGKTIGVALGSLVDSQNQIASLQRDPDPDDYFARLSRLNLNMVAQLARIGRGRPMVDLDYLITPADETDPKSTSPVDDLMASTRDVIEVLELMSRLSEFQAESIFRAVTLIVHNGADVSHVKTYRSLRNANVQSIKELVELSLLQGRRIPVHYVSTAGTATFSKFFPMWI
ncbi:hypothetical protein B0I35DRAFT_484087 [Stachybotrys elegans]|uniref:Thioester reductase (TE) domain-containing protein n=1 Tax=Stachybotrys elegans TaxID=80388 RepID=A0A8K0WKF3_9HYPO|nr:hypothetical protein B0I35DRAFT_484087 [Stachybotrys elegans]